MTSDQSNLTEDRIATADGWFSGIRHVMPTCPPVWAHWRHLANTIELVLPSAHPSAQPKRQIDRLAVSAQLTAESPYTLQLLTLCPKLTLIMGDLDPHLIHDSLGQSEPTIQMVSLSVQLFLLK